jgi:hypothetical protein
MSGKQNAKKQNAQGGGADALEEAKPAESELVSSEPVVEAMEAKSSDPGLGSAETTPPGDVPDFDEFRDALRAENERWFAALRDGLAASAAKDVGVGDRVLVYAPAFGHTIHVRGEGLKVEPKWQCEARPGFVMRVHRRDGSIELDVRVLADTDTDRVAESMPMVLGVRLLEITPRDPSPVPPSGVVAKPVAILNE